MDPSVLLTTTAAMMTFGGAAIALAPGAEVTLTLEDRVVQRISGDLFGQFLERPSWGGEFGPEAVVNDQGQLPEAVERHLRDLRAPLVRFPAGTDADYINWQDMIDLPGRPGRPATKGHQGGLVTNRFGYPEYFGLARRMKWRTILVGNLREALYRQRPLAEAAAHAAELLRYAKSRAPRGSITAFQVGNEGWFFWPPEPNQLAALNLADDDAAATWLRECLVAYADALHRVDPKVSLIADGPRPGDGRIAEVWTKAVDHPEVRARYRYLAAHAYAPMGIWNSHRNGVALQANQLTQDEVWDAAVATLGRFDERGQALADSTAYGDIQRLGYRAVVTEWNWNGWGFAKRFPQATFREGVPATLSSAGFLHGMMRHPNVDLATQSMMLGTTWGITAVRVNPKGRVAFGTQSEVTRLYAQYHGNELLASTLAGSPVVDKPVSLAGWWPPVARMASVDALVTQDRRAIYVHVIHRAREGTMTLNLPLPTTVGGAGVRVHTLTGEFSLSTAGGGELRRQTTTLTPAHRALKVVLPPASVSVIVIPRRSPRPPEMD